MNHRKIWHVSGSKWLSGHPSRQVASLNAVIHFSARLSFSEQKTMLSWPGWVRRNTRPAASPSYSSKFFCKKETYSQKLFVVVGESYI